MPEKLRYKNDRHSFSEPSTLGCVTELVPVPGNRPFLSCLRKFGWPGAIRWSPRHYEFSLAGLFFPLAHDFRCLGIEWNPSPAPILRLIHRDGWVLAEIHVSPGQIPLLAPPEARSL